MSTKERLHQLVDDLPESEFNAAQRFLEYLHSVHDEVDDEPLSAAAIEGIREAEDAMKRGEYVTLEEYRRTRGL